MGRRGELCVAAPVVGGGGVLLQLYYCTGWRPAVLHYQQQLRGEGGQQLQKQPWEEKHMEWCSGKELQQPDWHACELLLPQEIGRLEFVCCSADHKEWDNAPADEDDNQKKNYVISFCGSSSGCSAAPEQSPPDLMPDAARVADPRLAVCRSSQKKCPSGSGGPSRSGSSSTQRGDSSEGQNYYCNGDSKTVPGRPPANSTVCADSNRSSRRGSSSGSSTGSNTSGSSSSGSSSSGSSSSGSSSSDKNSGGSCSCRTCVKRIVCTLADGQLAAVEGPRCLLITDLDGTLIGNAAYVSQFLLHWKLRHLWRGSKLVYNTGRNLKDFLFAAGDNALLRPDFAILGVGTEVYEFSPVEELKSSRRIEEWLLDDNEREQFRDDIAFSSPQWPVWCRTRAQARISSRWLERLGGGTAFDRRKLARAAAENLPGCFVNGNIFYDPFRISLSVPASLVDAALQQQQQRHEDDHHEEKGSSSSWDPSSETDERQRTVGYLLQLLNNRRIKTCVSGQGDWRFVDLLPLNGGKRNGSQFVMEELGFAESETVVAGDSGNDAEMFLCRGVCGICVRNAQPDFVAFLQQRSSCGRSNVSPGEKHAAATAAEREAAGVRGKQAAGATEGGARGGKEAAAKLGQQQKQRPPHQEDTGEVCRVYFAERDCAGGVLEGLVHFAFDVKTSVQL